MYKYTLINQDHMMYLDLVLIGIQNGTNTLIY